MIIFLYGQDSYRRKKKLKNLIEQYKKNNDQVDIERFDFSDGDEEVDKAKDFLKQPSMFASSKISVIEEATKEKGKEWVETLKSYLEDEDVFILISDSTKKPVKKFQFLLESPVRSQKFEKLEGKKLSRFIKKDLQQRGLNLTPNAFKFLKKYASNQDSPAWASVMEIRKIDLSDFDEPVEKENLKKIISWVPRGKMFGQTKKLIQARSAAQKFIVLEELLSREESEAHVFNLLGTQVRGRDASKLADLDAKIKSGKLEYEEALLDFALF